MNTASRYSVPGLLQPRDGFGPNPVRRLLHLWVFPGLLVCCVCLNIQELFVESECDWGRPPEPLINLNVTPVKKVPICRVLCSFMNLCCSFWGLVCTTIAFCVVGCICLHVLCNLCSFAAVMSWYLAFPGPAVSTFRSWKLWVFFKSCNNKLMLSHFPCVYWTTGASHIYLLLGNRCGEVNLCCHVCAVALQGLNSTACCLQRGPVVSRGGWRVRSTWGQRVTATLSGSAPFRLGPAAFIERLQEKQVWSEKLKLDQI